ncbi:MAG: glycosyltransferase family 2 protein [Candidatus Omnitrophota bacterium]
MKVCVLIPAFNEHAAIGDTVKEARKLGLEVIVIDDGSTDGTKEVSEASGASVIRFEKNRGKGAALKEGFKAAAAADYEGIIVMDGDGQHDPKEIPKFIKKAQDTDAAIIIGNRMSDPKGMPFHRFITNLFMSAFLSLICGQKVPDSQCGYRLIKSAFLSKVNILSSNYEIESEMIIKAGRMGRKIESVPVESVYRGEKSRINPLKDTWRFFAMINRMVLGGRKR